MDKKSDQKENLLVKYHANGVIWSKGAVKNGVPHGYWEWYRADGLLKRSGHWHEGRAVGEWITYKDGVPYKTTQKD